MSDGRKNRRAIYTNTCMFFLTPEQHAFLKLYAQSKGVKYSKVLRAFINRLMTQYPALAKEAATQAERT